MKKPAKSLILALCLVLLLSSAVYASNRTKMMEVRYMDIKLVVDGVPIIPKYTNGVVVEPFIYEGTTYLPVRAVGEALGKQVSWDGNTQTVYIGNVPGKYTYLMDVCPPYETPKINDIYRAPEYFKMMGTTVFHGFGLRPAYDSSFAYFNLNGEYSTLEFDFGHMDGTNAYDATYAIYLDGDFVRTIDGTPDMMIQHISVPLNHALQLKIVCQTYDSNWAFYGFGNAVLK